MTITQHRRLRAVAAALGAVAVATCGDSTGVQKPYVGPVNFLIVSGDAQVGFAGQELASPLVAKVTDPSGNPVAGRVVTFHVTAGGGSVFSGASASDTRGIVQERWTLGTSTADTQRLEARGVDNVTGDPIVYGTFTAVVRSARAQTIAVSPKTATTTSSAPTVQLAATGTDVYGNALTAADLSWTSLDVGVATVSASGLVTGVTAGTARIVVTTLAPGGVADTATITVASGSGRQPTWVSVNPNPMNLVVGQSMQATAVAGDASGQIPASFTWTTTNASVASVDQQGVVTAHAAGVAVVFALTPGVSNGGTTVYVTAPPPSSALTWTVQQQASTVVAPVGAIYGSPTDIAIIGTASFGTVVAFPARYDGRSWTVDRSSDSQLSGTSGVWGVSTTDYYLAGSAIAGTNLVGAVEHHVGSTVTRVYTATGVARFLSAIWGTSPTDIWAVGEAAVHFDGNSWSVVGTSSLNGATFTAVWTNGTDTWLGDSQGQLRHIVGGSETSRSQPVASKVVGICGSSASDVFAATDNGRVAHWDGSGWTVQATFTDALSNIVCRSASDVWVGGNVVAHYNGASWQQLTSGSVPSSGWVVPTSSTTAWADRGFMVRYDGTAWTTDPAGVAATGVWGASPSDVWVIGGFGLLEHFDGVRWTGVHSLTADAVGHVHGTSSSNILAVAGSNSLKYDGVSWRVIPTPAPNVLVGLWVLSPTDAFAVGAAGGIVRFNGSSWSSMASGTSQILRGVWASSSSDAWAVGDGGTVLHFDGVNWSPVAIPTTRPLNGVWGSGPSDVFAISDNIIWHYDGTSWTQTVTGAAEPFRGIYGTSATDVYAVGDNEVYHFNGSWQAETTPPNGQYNSVWATPGPGRQVFLAGFPQVVRGQ